MRLEPVDGAGDPASPSILAAFGPDVLAEIAEQLGLRKHWRSVCTIAVVTIELHPETVELLRAIKPLKEMPEAPVFMTTTGTPIEPKTFSEHWHDALRALELRQRAPTPLKTH